MSSRSHKTYNIYQRVKNLVDSGLMKKENVPAWFAAYELCPPRIKCYERDEDELRGHYYPVRNIVYEEDELRL